MVKGMARPSIGSVVGCVGEEAEGCLQGWLGGRRGRGQNISPDTGLSTVFGDEPRSGPMAPTGMGRSNETMAARGAVSGRREIVELRRGSAPLNFACGEHLQANPFAGAINRDGVWHARNNGG